MGGIAVIARQPAIKFTGVRTPTSTRDEHAVAGAGIETDRGFDPRQIDLKPDLFVDRNVCGARQFRDEES